MTANEYGRCSDINCSDSCITVNILKIIELYILNRYCMACELYFNKAIVYFKKHTKKHERLHKQFPLHRKKIQKLSLSSSQQCKFKYLPLLMWRHYRKFFREISEVIVYEVQSPTISMFFWQLRMTQAIFRNALQKNALKTFSLNIHKLKIPTQARKNAWKIVLSLFRTVLFLLLFYVATLKERYEKTVLLALLLSCF